MTNGGAGRYNSRLTCPILIGTTAWTGDDFITGAHNLLFQAKWRGELTWTHFVKRWPQLHPGRTNYDTSTAEDALFLPKDNIARNSRSLWKR